MTKGITFALFFLLASLALLQGQSLIPRQNQEDWGYWNKNTETFAITGFQEALPFVSGLGLVRQGNKWGALGEDAQLLIPIEQDRIQHLTEGIFALQKEGKIHLYGMPAGSLNGPFRDAALLKDRPDILVLADEKGNYGLLRTSGQQILPFAFCGPPTHLGEGLLLPRQEGQKINYGVYSVEGKEIIPPIYYKIELWDGKYYNCRSADGFYYLLDTSGKTLLNRQKSKIQGVMPAFFILGEGEIQQVILRKNGASYTLKEINFWGKILVGYDSMGAQLLLSPEGEVLRLTARQRLLQVYGDKILICQLNVRKDCSRQLLIDIQGKEVIPPLYDEISSWNDKWAVVRPERKEEKYGLIELKKGKSLLPAVYERIYLLDHDYLQVYRDGESQFLGPDLQPARWSYDDLPLEGEYYYAVRLSYLRPYRNNPNLPKELQSSLKKSSNKKIVIPLEINEVKPIRDKYNNSSLPDRMTIWRSYRLPGPPTALMALDGRALTGFEYTSISYHEQGLIHVYGHDSLDGGIKVVHGLVDFEGNIQIPLVYDNITDVGKQYILVEKYGLWGVISHDNQAIIPIQYGHIRYIAPGYFLLKKFEKWGIASLDGSILAKPQYDEIKPLERGFQATLQGKTIFLDSQGKSAEDK